MKESIKYFFKLVWDACTSHATPWIDFIADLFGPGFFGWLRIEARYHIERALFGMLIQKEGRGHMKALPDTNYNVRGPCIRLEGGGKIDPWRHEARLPIVALLRLPIRDALHAIAWTWRTLRAADGYIFPMRVSLCRYR